MRTHDGRERAVVVTGASSGIGEACVLHLAASGHRVFAGIRRSEDGEALRGRGGPRVIPVPLDVTDEASIRAAAARIEEAVGAGGIHALINNAGIAVWGPLESTAVPRLRGQLEVNVVGPIAVTQALLPSLRRAAGRIVFVGSIAGLVSLPFLAPYSASKSALEAVADAWRLELRPWGIHVVIVEPGYVPTPIWRKAAETFDETLAAVPPALRPVYEPVLRRLQQSVGRTGGIAPAVVAERIAEILETRHPKARYVIGRDARLRRLLRVLPDPLRDRLIRRRLGQ